MPERFKIGQLKIRSVLSALTEAIRFQDCIKYLHNLRAVAFFVVQTTICEETDP